MWKVRSCLPYKDYEIIAEKLNNIVAEIWFCARKYVTLQATILIDFM